jgi:hypothetical protein
MCEIETLATHNPNFIVCNSVETANKVNLKIYRLLERMSEPNNFIFIKRAKQL